MVAKYGASSLFSEWRHFLFSNRFANSFSSLEPQAYSLFVHLHSLVLHMHLSPSRFPFRPVFFFAAFRGLCRTRSFPSFFPPKPVEGLPLSSRTPLPKKLRTTLLFFCQSGAVTGFLFPVRCMEASYSLPCRISFVFFFSKYDTLFKTTDYVFFSLRRYWSRSVSGIGWEDRLPSFVDHARKVIAF